MVEEKNERNPLTHRRHRKELFWQISAPILIGTLILLVLAFLATQMGVGEIGRWADISLIWIIAPLMFFLLITFAALVAGIYATVRVIQVLPAAAYRLHKNLVRVSAAFQNANDRMVEPVLRLHTFSASLKTLKRQLSRRRS